MVIPDEVRRDLEAHARDALPAEACGVLVLSDSVAVRYERGRNRLESAFRYELEVDPEVFFLEDEGYELAVFHTHPESKPWPSRTDIENIGLWEGRPYLIMRADTGELRAFLVEGGEVSELPLPASPG